ncbi:MAG: hypothetical protein A2Y17_06180 [Clostridiales bacterium GWF2_38_85]|nr:MAG: hypothetical protein A2Y17_06180 [Clostridiales bacterium GWF2_38_85]
MKLLYGTGNQAKLDWMRSILKGLEIEIIGLKDLGCDIPTVEETGNSPLENARIKAKAYYKAFGMPVFSCDSGLYFENIPENLQPGVNVRNVGGKYLNDDEMLEHYSSLVGKYGDLVAKYKNGICLIIDDEHIYESMDDSLSGNRFLIVKTPHPKKVEGFPLDRLSVHISSGKYYYDIDNKSSDRSAFNEGFRKFFRELL